MAPPRKRLAGIATTQDLLRQNLSTPAIRSLCAAGRLIRLRQGWYGLPDADEVASRAVRLGGVLSCCSALAWYGVWTPPGTDLHVRCSDHGRREWVDRPGVRRCTVPRALAGAPGRPVDSLPASLAAAVRCLDDEGLVVVMDSILNLKLLTRADILDALCFAPPRALRLFERCDRSESGTETMVRLRLRAKGVAVRAQVRIPGVGRVDLLVGERLVIEVDSREHHTDAQAYEADRLRDRGLVTRGYLVVRLTYHQVLMGWDTAWADLRTLIRQGRHHGLTKSQLE